MRSFCFTVDDNIRFLRELTEGDYKSIFDHPYLAMYLRLHKRYGLKVQLNLFFSDGEFELASVSDRIVGEWRDNSDWLRLSFHSRIENVKPYERSGYAEVYSDCAAVNGEIVRFASREALADTTTVHYCLLTEEGVRALADNGIKGLLGLYGTSDEPWHSYQCTPEECERIRRGETVYREGIAYAGIDIVLNKFSEDEIALMLGELSSRDFIKVMIHEQYFYPDYKAYQPNFEKKLDSSFALLHSMGYESRFF